MTETQNRKIHIALSVGKLDEIIDDYSRRLGCKPEVIVQNQYALWRTETVNLSIRVDPEVAPGSLRHLGFEDENVEGFTSSTDPLGIVWESFREQDQKAEINDAWPGAV